MVKKKKFKAYLKIEPIIETEEQDYPTDEEIVDLLTEMSMNIMDYIGFDEIEE